jgi:hypothetical protein
MEASSRNAEKKPGDALHIAPRNDKIPAHNKLFAAGITA